MKMIRSHADRHTAASGFRLKTWILLAIVLAAPIGCRQQMANQPAYRPLEESNFFQDKRIARPLVEGVVPRGMTSYSEYAAIGPRPMAVGDYTPASRVASGSLPASTGARSVASPAPEGAPGTHAELVSLEQIRAAGYTDKIPFAVTAADMQRGQQRFNIYCAVCHDAGGGGKGTTVERGFTKPPSYHTERLRGAPLGYFYHVISHGYGSMPDYATQIPARDRWLIAAYVRALQVGQNITLSSLPVAEQQTALSAIEAEQKKAQPAAETPAPEKLEKH